MFQVVKKTEAESLTAFNRYVVVDRWINIILTYRTDQKKPNRERLTECILLPFHTHSHSHSLAIPNQFWGGGRGYLTKFTMGEVLPRRLTPYSFIDHFGRKGTPFIYLLLRKSTLFTYLLQEGLFSFSCSA